MDNLLRWCSLRVLLSLLILDVFGGNLSAHAGEWEFQGFTIAESTPVFERTAISTAGEPNPNNQGGSRHDTARWTT